MSSGSTRRCGTTSRIGAKEIQEHLDEVGFRTARAAQLATLATRRAKKAALDEGSMRDLWEAKAGEIGWDPATLADVVDRVPRSSASPSTSVRSPRTWWAPDGLTAQASSFDRRDVLRGICDRLPAGATVAGIEAIADRVLARADVVASRRHRALGCCRRT